MIVHKGAMPLMGKDHHPQRVLGNWTSTHETAKLNPYLTPYAKLTENGSNSKCKM
jgi:hypothetical protein